MFVCCLVNAALRVQVQQLLSIKREILTIPAFSSIFLVSGRAWLFHFQIYYLVRSGVYTIKLYSIVYYKFGLYAYKVNVRRENEIVTLFSSLLFLFLIFCGHLRARSGIFKRACVIWDSGAKGEKKPKPWVLLFSFLETGKCHCLSLVCWFNVCFPPLGASSEIFL